MLNLGLRQACFVFVIGAWVGCATIPKGRYGVEEINVQGTEEMDEDALKACLATHERPAPPFNISRNPSPECGKPPFDADHLELPIWPGSWPWMDWPLFDRSVFERDLDRIERWYQARGYYDARVLSSMLDPPEAGVHGAEFRGCMNQEEGCKLRAWVQVREGEPTLVDSIRITSTSALKPEVKQVVYDALKMRKGERFDEATYEETKEALLRALRDASFAKAQVGGEVQIDAKQRRAHIRLDLNPGPACYFEDVRIRIEGNRSIPTDVVLYAAKIDRGEPFSVTAIEEAQRAVYALGAFSSVEVEPDIQRDGTRIDVDIKIVPGKLVRFGVGAGFMSGLITRLEGYDAQDVRQWDVHLLGFAEFRNAFGGLQRVRIEERPRLVFRQQFPIPHKPTLGNVLTLDSRWPNFLEGRTSLVAGSQWDIGPDLFGRSFQRNVIDARAGPQRTWSALGGTLFGSVGLHYNLFFPFDDQDFDVDPRSPGNQRLQSYRVLFLENYVYLDLRDDPQRPHEGIFTDLSVHTAGYLKDVSFWTYARVVPDVRVYLPLPLGIVFASRLRVGAMYIMKSADGLDVYGDRLGPYSYRLRGGGANSNRGFLPGFLGDGIEGGLRRWEASMEFRVSLTESFGTVFFADAGDVIDATQFRFDRPQVSVGIGFRYLTIIGPLRFDLGYRVPGLQTVGDAVLRRQPYNLELGFFSMPGAFNLTIGEAF